MISALVTATLHRDAKRLCLEILRFRATTATTASRCVFCPFLIFVFCFPLIASPFISCTRVTGTRVTGNFVDYPLVACNGTNLSLQRYADSRVRRGINCPLPVIIFTAELAKVKRYLSVPQRITPFIQ